MHICGQKNVSEVFDPEGYSPWDMHGMNNIKVDL
jgi:hypothetical protein